MPQHGRVVARSMEQLAEMLGLTQPCSVRLRRLNFIPPPPPPPPLSPPPPRVKSEPRRDWLLLQQRLKKARRMHSLHKKQIALAKQNLTAIQKGQSTKKRNVRLFKICVIILFSRS
jgi:hypothetical protein